MTKSDTIVSLVRSRASDELGRDNYWSRMRQHHVRLLDYGPLLRRAGFRRIEIGELGLILVDDDGLRWAWDPGQIRSPLSVRMNDGSYEDAEWRLLRSLAASTDTVVDVGANMGWYAVRLTRLAGVRRVHAFEPVPATYESLRTNQRLNRLGQRIRTYRYGLSDRRTSAVFFIPRTTGNVAASEHQLFDDEDQERVEVQLRRLDDVDLGSRPGLIKCDVEGGEFGFLRGAERSLDAWHPFVVLEMLRKWSKRYGYHPNDVIEWMSDRGYRCFGIGDRIQQVVVVDEETVATNFVFVHRTRLDDFAALLRPDFEDVRRD